MTDGVFANGGDASSDLVMGHAGLSDFDSPPGVSEATFSVASAYFPYEQGWQGAWVQRGGDWCRDVRLRQRRPLHGLCGRTARQAFHLPGVNSATDGMLFVAPSNGSSNTRIASAFPDGAGGWTATVRLDYLIADGLNFAPEEFLTSGNDFPVSVRPLLDG